MSTFVTAISAEGNPDFLFYDDGTTRRCLYKIKEPMPDGVPLRTLTGIKLGKDQFTSYDDCEACREDNATNTLYVRYEIDENQT